MNNAQSSIELIKQRRSCRNYKNMPIEEDKRQALVQILTAISNGPFGSSSRFRLVAVTEADRSALRGLGTYGFIHRAPGFIIGATRDLPGYLEDFGFQMERIILGATALGLGTCWLGGSFTRSSFSSRISAMKDEILPAVCAVGYMDDNRKVIENVIRRSIGSINRLPWKQIFYDLETGRSLEQQDAGIYTPALEMLRLSPSASNKQPWRILKQGNRWHFFLKRTDGYGRSLLTRMLDVADLQRVDMGIAMCHFEMASLEIGLKGSWEIHDPGGSYPGNVGQYLVSWVDKSPVPSIHNPIGFITKQGEHDET